MTIHFGHPAEIKSLDGATGEFSGYGAVFGNVDLGRDVIVRGAFAESLGAWFAKGRMPAMLWYHDPEKPIGAWQEMREDDKGLFVRGKLTKGVAKADEAYALLKDKAIDGLSIGFVTRDDDYDRQTNVRTLKRLDIKEVSLVTFPMNPEARAESVKALADGIDGIESLSDAERLLREAAGFSRKEARDFVSRMKRVQREAEAEDERKRLLADMRAVNDALKPL